eukprot:scaffold177_cov334-Pavlova_lutheri.AAC.78
MVSLDSTWSVGQNWTSTCSFSVCLASEQSAPTASARTSYVPSLAFPRFFARASPPSSWGLLPPARRALAAIGRVLLWRSLPWCVP